MGVKKEKTTNKRLLVIFIIFSIASLVLITFYSGIIRNNPDIDRTIRVACVGDSITEGSDYPDYLWMMLGADYIIENFGVGGATVILQSDKPYMNQTAFQRVKIYLPDIILIMLGTNDAIPNNYEYIDNFAGDYITLVGEFKALDSNPKIWLVLPPPIYDNTLGPNSTNLVAGVLPRIGQVANEMNLPLINIYEVLTGHPECFVDGVHLNRQGVDLLVTSIYLTIND